MAVDLLNSIIFVFANYSFLICFVSGLLGGIVWLLVLASLAANGIFSLWALCIFFYVGIVICDIFLFHFGKLKSLSYFKKHRFLYRGYQKVSFLIQKYSKNRDGVFLFFSKFVYGLYAPLIMYFGRKGMKFKKFLLMDLFVNLIWMVILVPIGWFAGKGLRFFLNLEDNIYLIVVAFLILLILVYLIKKLFSVVVSKDFRQKFKQKIK